MIHFYGLKIYFSDFCFLTLIKGFIVRAGIWMVKISCGYTSGVLH